MCCSNHFARSGRAFYPSDSLTRMKQTCGEWPARSLAVMARCQPAPDWAGACSSLAAAPSGSAIGLPLVRALELAAWHCSSAWALPPNQLAPKSGPSSRQAVVPDHLAVAASTAVRPELAAEGRP